MKQMTLGKTGLKISGLGLGGIPIQRVSETEAIRTIHAALDLGITFFDTAAGYSDSQKKMGKAFKGHREQVVIATKAGNKDREGILKEVNRSLNELQTDYIDLYQFHGISSMAAWRECESPGGALEGLMEAKKKGFIRHIGITSHSLDTSLELVEHPLIETLQLPFNLVAQEPLEKIIPRCRERNVGFIVMKPLCGGQYHNARLAFKFLNAFSDIVPIPGVESPAQIQEIARIVESGEVLTGDEKTEAERIARDLGKLFCRRCGYCEPCPQGIPIQTAMVFDGFLNRVPLDKVKNHIGKNLAEKGPSCIECGECERKCPYNLPVMDTVKASTAKAQGLLDGSWSPRQI